MIYNRYHENLLISIDRNVKKMLNCNEKIECPVKGGILRKITYRILCLPKVRNDQH